MRDLNPRPSVYKTAACESASKWELSSNHSNALISNHKICSRGVPISAVVVVQVIREASELKSRTPPRPKSRPLVGGHWGVQVRWFCQKLRRDTRLRLRGAISKPRGDLKRAARKGANSFTPKDICLQQGLGVLKNEIARFRFNLLIDTAQREGVAVTRLNIALFPRLIAARRSDAAFSGESAQSTSRGRSLNDVILNAIVEHTCYIAGAG